MPLKPNFFGIAEGRRAARDQPIAPEPTKMSLGTLRRPNIFIYAINVTSSSQSLFGEEILNQEKPIAGKTIMPYKPKWVLSSKVRGLFVFEDQKVRISGEAKDKVMEYLDKAVEKGVKDLIEKLPKKSKGPEKGGLKRITLQMEDLQGI